MSDSTIHPPKQDIRVVVVDLKRVDRNGVCATFICYFPDLDLRVRGCLWDVSSDGKEWVGLPRRAWTGNDGGTRHSKFVSFGRFKSDKAFQTAALAAVHELDARAP